MNSQNHLLKQGEHTTNNVVTNRSILTNNMISKTFSTTVNTQYEFSIDDITTYTPPTSPGGPGGGISLFITYYDYTVRVYKGTSTTAFYTTQFNLSNATRVINFATDSTTSQIRIEISRGLATTQGYSKFVDNLKLRKFTGNTSVYSTNYSNMSLTANALDGWSPDNWATTSATVDQSAGQYRLVAIGSGATAKVQREFTALPNQEHRFQYNLSLLNGGSATVHVQQFVGSAYIDVPGVSQTQTTSGTYELSFVPNYEDIRISVSGTSRYALQNLYLDRDQIDTLVATYALSRGYRYGFNGMEKDDEVKGRGNSYTTEYRQYDARLGRWMSIDPLAYDYPWQSPYVAFDNDPILLIDPDGRASKEGDKRLSVGARFKNWISGNSHKNWVNKIASQHGINESDISLHENKEVAAFKVGNTLHVQSRKTGFSFSEIDESDGSKLGAFISYRSNISRGVKDSDFGDEGFNWDNIVVHNTQILLIGPDIGGPTKGKSIINAGSKALSLLSKIKSSKGLIKAAQLPTKGKIRFVPRVEDIKNGQLLQKNHGYVDKFGNVWTKPKGNIVGEAHWDVQLSGKGKKMLGHLSNSGSHINVTPSGTIAH